jgi:hypothetical protein
MALSFALYACGSAAEGGATQSPAPSPAPGKRCTQGPEYRQFDFWVGEWDVSEGGKPAGTNSIQLILGDCVVFENWTGVGGMTGKSFNLYDARRKRWQQTWVDNNGGLLELYGSYSDRTMRLEGETPVPAGGGTGGAKHKITWFDQGPDQLRQLWEQSTDGGKTWKVLFDGSYKRRKS